MSNLIIIPTYNEIENISSNIMMSGFEDFRYIRTIADYPVKGIQFRDITTLLQDAGHFKQVIDDMTKPWKNKKIDAVLSIESRGFIMAGAIAYFLNAAFIPLRKPNKLPFETFKVLWIWLSGTTTKFS